MSLLPPISQRPMETITIVDKSNIETFEPLPFINTPEPKSTTFKSQTEPNRKRRGGWWDSSKNIETDMEKIKQMIQNRKVNHKPFVTEENDGNDVEDTPTKKISETKAEPLLSVQLNPIHQSGSISGDQIPKTRSVSNSKEFLTIQDSIPDQTKAVVNSNKNEVYFQPIAPAAEKPKHRKHRKPWYYEPVTENIIEETLQKSPEIKPITPKIGKKTSEMKPLTPKVGDARLNPILSNIKKIVNENPSHVGVDSIMIFKHLLDTNMEKSADLYCQEAKLAEEKVRSLRLEHYVQNRDFGRAVVLVQQVLHQSGDKGASMLPSFDDLIYVLSKYLLISLYQLGQISIAGKTLKMVIFPMVQKEQKRGGIRSEWFTKDYFLLDNLLSDHVFDENIYKSLNWDEELTKFWCSIEQLEQKQVPPLFAYALATYFKPIKMTRIQDFLNDSVKIKRIENLIGVENLEPFQKPPTIPESQVYLSKSANSKNSSSESLKNIMEKKSNTPSEITSSTTQSRYTLKLQEDLPPISSENETSNFALSKVCGPLNSIRVMDAQTLHETGQIIAVTAGTERDITIWDLKQNSILTSLQNSTVKPVVIVQFHPHFPELIFTADMEFDVKLWNWKEGSLVRWWKKHHTRIIYQMGFIPGDDTRAVTCSGDQSLKIWNIHADKTTTRASVHANEPITSFTFSGSPTDPLQQKLIISLSYSIRIYKVRTLALVHSIQLSDLKLTKSPVFYMEAHPLFDTYILLSTDNQLRLFDLNTEKVVKTFSSRFNSQHRMRGHFSPNGTFIYANTHEYKVGSHPRHQEQEEHEEYTTGSLIWRLHTGKLEKREMHAMQDTELEHAGAMIQPTGVLSSKWFEVIDRSKKGTTKRYKVLVTAGIDKLLRLYI